MISQYPISESALRWLELILSERFGSSWHLKYKQSGISLSLDGSVGEIFFDNLNVFFTEARSDLPFTLWDAEQEGWKSALRMALPTPGEDQLMSPLIEKNFNNYIIHFDILGLTYWMLNRIEEIDRKDLDDHGRFPASASHAYAHEYLNRPIVDEWLNILGQVIKKQWPLIKLHRHHLSIRLSHDVDSPSLYAFKSWKTITRMMAGHIIKRHDLKAFFTAPYVKFVTRSRLINADPFNTFDWLMDVSEANNLRSTFYFICGHTSKMDSDYEINNPIIQDLLSRIHRRGHEIGLHPSYETYQSPDLIQKEASQLRHACLNASVAQTEFGARMHYLRWKHPKTLKALFDAGLNHDSSLGYADLPGFRCGTCFEYPAFYVETQHIIQLRIRPLIAMETSIFSKSYMGVQNQVTAEMIFMNLIDACDSVGGCFTLLWHNSSLHNKVLRSIYLRLISRVINRSKTYECTHY